MLWCSVGRNLVAGAGKQIEPGTGLKKETCVLCWEYQRKIICMIHSQ